MGIYFYRNILSTILIATLFFYNTSVYALSTAKLHCVSLLPKEALHEIATHYKNWKILEIEDLVSDDRTIWKKYHKEDCPGVISGQYDSSNKKAYAVLIVQETSGKKKTKILSIKKVGSGQYSSEVLHKEKNVINYPVIYNGEPGFYSDFYDKRNKIKIDTETVICEHLEASAIAFYFKKSKYHKLLISD